TSVIDAYIKRLSSTSLKEDVRRLTWLNAFFRVLSAFFGFIKPSSRAEDSFQKPLGELSVGDKVTVLLSITDKVVTSMESAPNSPLSKCLDAFRLHLINIDDEIVAKKELGVPYEDSVNTALNTAIEHLVTELGSEIDQCEEQSESTPLIKELLNKVRPKRDEPDESNAARLTM
ncbi:MAG: hypothetical protein B7X00_02075, partial [Legionella sp. 21-45-4]